MGNLTMRIHLFCFWIHRFRLIWILRMTQRRQAARINVCSYRTTVPVRIYTYMNSKPSKFLHKGLLTRPLRIIFSKKKKKNLFALSYECPVWLDGDVWGVFVYGFWAQLLVYTLEALICTVCVRSQEVFKKSYDY